MAHGVRIYFEGDRRLRSGFRSFFQDFFQGVGRVALVPCGAKAIEHFMGGLKSHPDAFNVLLIDSEGPYTPDLLRQIRQHDHWDAAIGRRVSNDYLHFMVQVMESWFLADRAALETYYGPGLAENRLPPNPRVEQISKDDVLNGLSAATRETRKGRYHKTNHAPELLSAIDPAIVRAAAPSCDRLFNDLAQMTG